MAKSKVFKKYEDNNDGFLAVKYQELLDLGLENHVTVKSFRHGASVYLSEEGGDMSMFIRHWEAKYGPLVTTCKHQKDRSTVRNYKAYQVPRSEPVVILTEKTDGQLDSVVLKTVTGTLVNAGHFMNRDQKDPERVKEFVSDLPLELNLPEAAVNLKSDF